MAKKKKQKQISKIHYESLRQAILICEHEVGCEFEIVSLNSNSMTVYSDSLKRNVIIKIMEEHNEK